MTNKTLKLLLQASLVVICFYFIIQYFIKHEKELEIIRQIDITYIAIITFLTVILNIISAYCFFAVLKTNIPAFKFSEWFKIFVVARFINFHIIQGSVIYRGLKLKKDYNFAYTDTLGLAVFFSWLGLISMSILSIIVLGTSNYAVEEKSLIFSIIGAFACLMAAFPFTIDFLLQRIKNPPAFLNWIHNRFSHLIRTVTNLIKNFNLSLDIFSLTFLMSVLYIVTMYFCFAAINIQLDIMQVSVFTIVLLLSRAVNIVPGNVGISELICGAFAKSLGIGMGGGVIVSGIYRIIEYFLLGALTVFFNRNIRDLFPQPEK